MTDYIDGTFSSMGHIDTQLDQPTIDAIHKTWSGLVEDMETVNKGGLVFPESCWRCGKQGKWDYEIKQYESGLITTELECKECNATYERVGWMDD